MPKVKTVDLIDEFNLELISGEEGINRPITVSDLSRPGLEIAGYFDYYPADRIQILGMTELTFFSRLTPEERLSRMESLCSDITPCIIVTRGIDIPEELILASEKVSVQFFAVRRKQHASQAA